jgi:hypothetical protein
MRDPRSAGRSTHRPILLALAVAMAATMLAGLAAARLLTRGSGEPDATQLLERSVRRTTDRDGLAYEVDLRVEGPSQPRELNVAGSTMVTTAAAQGTIQMLGDTPTEVDFLLQGRRLFLQAGGDRGDRAAWAEVDLLAALSDTGDDVVAVLGLGLQRPTELLEMLRGIQQAQRVGSETVGGIATERYRGTVSLEAALERPSRLADAALVRKVTERLDGDELIVDAWIDANGKVRRLRLGGTLDGGHQYELGMRLTSFGEPVRVEAPDAVPVEPLDLPHVLGLKRTA